MSDASLQLLHDADINRALEGVEHRAFRYTKNEAGARLMTGVAAVSLALCAGTWWVTGWADPFVMALGVLAGSFGFAMVWYLWHWHTFVGRHFVAISQEHLYVGWAAQKGRAWKIAWELLDRESLGLTRMRTTRLSCVLPIRVAGNEVDLHLFQPLAFMTHYQDLLQVLLAQTATDEELAEAQALLDAQEDEEEVVLEASEEEVSAKA